MTSSTAPAITVRMLGTALLLAAANQGCDSGALVRLDAGRDIGSETSVDARPLDAPQDAPHPDATADTQPTDTGTDTRPGDAGADAQAIDARIDAQPADATVVHRDSTVADALPPDTTPAPFCIDCVNIRVGRPLVARGPAGDELDNGFSAIPLADNQWRGFSASGTTYALTGAQPWAMGGPRTAVLGLGPAGSDHECGQWINDTKRVGNVVHGFIHWERACNYAIGQTHKTLAYGSSSDEGRNWTVQGMIIRGQDQPTPGRTSGEGDCQQVSGADGYEYLYCLRASDWKTIVARAPSSALGPGSWKKYYRGAWNEPGLGGNADSLGFIGTGVGQWVTHGQVLAIAQDKWFGGLKLSFSTDRVSFTRLAEPVIAFDEAAWNRPAPSELYAYTSINNPSDGSSDVTHRFLLAHIYVQPGEAFDRRYLVFRDVTIWLAAAPTSPQVGVALSRWHNAALKDRWTTTAPVPGNFEAYTFDKPLGYLMTRAHPSLSTNKLEDCVSNWPGHPDHLLSIDGTCTAGGYTRLRTAGWVYREPQASTVPIYRCYNSQDEHHFASIEPDCEGLGTSEGRLGYALAP